MSEVKELNRNLTPVITDPFEINSNIAIYKKGTRYHIRFINEEYMLQFDQKILRKFVNIILDQIIQFFDKFPEYTEKFFRVYKAYLEQQEGHSEKLLKTVVAVLFEGFDLIEEFLADHPNITELKLPTDKKYKQLIELDKIKDLIYYSWKLKLYSFYKFLVNVKINKKVDAVVIAVPTSLHYAIGKEFIEEGIHTLLEKPCTDDLGQAEELFDLAAKKKVTLHIGHIERFNGAVQELFKIVKDPIYIECKRMSPFSPRSKDDGVVLDIMIHDIDIVLNLVDSDVAKINVIGNSIFSKRDDLINAQIEFENGCIANLLASRVSQNKVRTLEVTQKESSILLDYTEQEIFIHRQSSSESQLSPGELRYKQESLVERIFVHKDNPLKLELKHFIDCAANGSKRKLSVKKELNSLKIALQILSHFESRR